MQHDPDVDDEDTIPLMLLYGNITADRFACASQVRQFGLRVGLSVRRSEELALAASELASNVARHAYHGTLELRLVNAPRRHVLMVCRDSGPGIADFALARRDGYTARGPLAPETPRREGLGLGLGAVERLVDQLEVSSIVGTGTTIVARKYVP
jgi:serine/threonine-protein kinase RsbT